MQDVFRRERIGVPGPDGHTISSGDWTDVRDNRLPAVERVAAALNPYPLRTNSYISSQTHGLGGTRISAAITAEQVLWVPIFVPTAFTSLAMAVYVSTAVAGASLQLGLYNGSGGLQQDFGVADAATTGWKTLTIVTAVTVSNGLNYLCVHANNIAGISIDQLTDGLGMFHSLATLTIAPSFRSTATFGTLPATVATGSSLSTAPLLAIRVDP